MVGSHEAGGGGVEREGRARAVRRAELSPQPAGEVQPPVSGSVCRAAPPWRARGSSVASASCYVKRADRSTSRVGFGAVAPIARRTCLVGNELR